MSDSVSTPILEAQNITIHYGERQVINDLSFKLNHNEVLCLIGHNGAGKSTLLKALFALLKPSEGAIFFEGKNTISVTPRILTEWGVAMVPEGRGIFQNLTVSEVLRLGLWAAGVPKSLHAPRIEWVTQVLPAIKQFYDQIAGTLSGGQQQIVSLGRALLSQPRCLLLDEPSIGLAPKLFQDLMGPVRQLQQDQKMSILIVEQNVREALKISDRVIVMKSGALIHEALPSDFNDNADLINLY